MTGYTVNQQKCKRCKLCIEVCPVNMIGFDNENHVHFISERESICLECGQCMAICPTESIEIAKYSYADNLFKLPQNQVNYQKFTDFIATRRSVRNFINKPIERSVLAQILAVLDYAPYGAEPNKVEITVVNNRSTIEAALPLTEKFLDDIVDWVDNPIISRIIKHRAGIETFSTLKNHLYPMAKLGNYKLEFGDRITRGAPALIIFHARNDAEEHHNNALIYATYVLFAAHSLGLGATMNGIMPAAINKVDGIQTIFQIPKEHEAIISVMLGYPKYKYSKIVRRENKKIFWIE